MTVALSFGAVVVVIFGGAVALLVASAIVSLPGWLARNMRPDSTTADRRDS